MQRWQNKIRSLRRFLRGWAKNQIGEKRCDKNILLSELDILDRKAEFSLLSLQELEYKNCLSSQLKKLVREEELYWQQRSKGKKI